MSLGDAIGWTADGIIVLGGWYLRTDRPRGLALLAVSLWMAFVASLLIGDLIDAAIFGAGAALATWFWWKHRRKGRGRKALRELGDKSRRRIQALVDNLTPSPVPSPAGG